MGSIINKIVYPKILPSYDETLPYLKFVTKDNYRVPIRHYILDKNLNTLLMAHSNSEDIGMMDIEKLSNQFNCNIVIFDYANYGIHSYTIPSEDNCKKDIILVYNYLRTTTPSSKIILYGRSLGTGPATYLASFLNCKLILVSPFKSILKTCINISGPFDQFRNECVAPFVKGPVLIIHGCNDKVTDYNLSKELACIFPNLAGFVTIHGAGHHCIYKHQLYFDTIRKFVN